MVWYIFGSTAKAAAATTATGTTKIISTTAKTKIMIINFNLYKKNIERTIKHYKIENLELGTDNRKRENIKMIVLCFIRNEKK